MTTKHGIRSGIYAISDMSNSEESGGGAQAAAPQTLNQASGEGSGNMALAMPTLPSGLKLPPRIKTDGNLATNWKHLKRTWDNYAIAARLECFNEKFLLVIGEDALEIFDGMDFTPETDNQVLNKLVKKCEEFCIRETNETYETFIFNRRNQEENQGIDQYVTVLQFL